MNATCFDASKCGEMQSQSPLPSYTHLQRAVLAGPTTLFKNTSSHSCFLSISIQLFPLYTRIMYASCNLSPLLKNAQAMEWTSPFLFYTAKPWPYYHSPPRQPKRFPSVFRGHIYEDSPFHLPEHHETTTSTSSRDHSLSTGKSNSTASLASHDSYRRRT